MKQDRGCIICALTLCGIVVCSIVGWVALTHFVIRAMAQ